VQRNSRESQTRRERDEVEREDIRKIQERDRYDSYTEG
jgi:hypothetical protein